MKSALVHTATVNTVMEVRALFKKVYKSVTILHRVCIIKEKEGKQ